MESMMNPKPSTVQYNIFCHILNLPVFYEGRKVLVSSYFSSFSLAVVSIPVLSSLLLSTAEESSNSFTFLSFTYFEIPRGSPSA